MISERDKYTQKYLECKHGGLSGVMLNATNTHDHLREGVDTYKKKSLRGANIQD